MNQRTTERQSYRRQHPEEIGDGGNDRCQETRQINTVRLWQVKRRGHTMVGVSSVIVGHEVAAPVFLQV